jgi:hypothetical protein
MRLKKGQAYGRQCALCGVYVKDLRKESFCGPCIKLCKEFDQRWKPTKKESTHAV